MMGEELNAFGGFQWVEQPRKGQAAARNNGSFVAHAPILLFLDDDVVPDRDLLTTHFAHHASGQRIAVLGDCEIARSDELSLCELAMWGWWEDTNHRRSALGQPGSYLDFCTRNVSLRRAGFACVRC